MKAPKEQAVQAARSAESPDEFFNLLNGNIKPSTPQAEKAIEEAVRTLAEQALAQVARDWPSDAYTCIEMIIAEIDRKLSEQVNEIIHHDAFQAVESAWRGLNHLISNTETDEMLKIRVMDISKEDLAKTLKRYQGTAWDQSPIFKRIYEEEYGQDGGQPYGCLVGDYYFDHTAPDVELLRSVSNIAAAAHAPFIAAASPVLFQMDSWQQLADPRDLTRIFEGTEYTSWRSLRESEDTRYLGLTLPRFLARLPYDPVNNPVDEFTFIEDVDGRDHRKYLWANSAYAMGVNINRAFKQFGWCTTIRGSESGGQVENLFCHNFPTDDGGVDMKSPTEIAISDRREAELAKNGFIPLIHRKNSDTAVFRGAQSLQRPQAYMDSDATSNAMLSASLPYIFASSRFAHYLKCIVRDKIGSFTSRESMQKWLTDWITYYVDADPANSSQETKAKRPLAAAEIELEDVEGQPGYYKARFYLRPHYQLEGLNASLRLVSKLPSEKAA